MQALRSRLLSSLTRSLILSFAAACLIACGDAGQGASDAFPAPDSIDSGEQSGSLTIALDPGADLTFSAFSYAIIRPGFTRSGEIDVSRSSSVSTTVAGLPQATGYSLSVIGTASAPVEAQCSGSATFDIVAGQITSVPVAISCHVNEVVNPPAQPVPVPPSAPVVLGTLLAAAGMARVQRRNGRGRNV